MMVIPSLLLQKLVLAVRSMISETNYCPLYGFGASEQIINLEYMLRKWNASSVIRKLQV